jgi:hypothetical protein
MPKKAAKRNKRPKNYEPKLQLDESVTFDSLMQVAINHKQPEKKATPKKKK